MDAIFPQGEVAVVTGAASGIGRAAARRAAASGMRVVLVDVAEEKLRAATAEMVGIGGQGAAVAEAVDVSDFGGMTALAKRVEALWGSPSLLMNNAAAFVSGGAGGILDPIENWQRLMAVNAMGVVNGVQAFLPGMLKTGKRGRIVNTGSKQGLTNPPGNPAYNTSKAAVNAYSQNLAQDLRDRPGSRISAHLLIPGWTTTGDREHKPGAWLPQQVVDYMAAALERDAFFILCPDEETPNVTDRKRIIWNALDIVYDRPALSRWHPSHRDAFAAFMARDLPPGFGG